MSSIAHVNEVKDVIHYHMIIIFIIFFQGEELAS